MKRNFNLSQNMILRSRRRIRTSSPAISAINSTKTSTNEVNRNLFKRNSTKENRKINLRKGMKVEVNSKRKNSSKIIKKNKNKQIRLSSLVLPLGEVNSSSKKTKRSGKLARISSNTRSATKKQKEKTEKSVDSNCIKCHRDIKLTKSESYWKNLCFPCFAKTKGKIVNCSACNFEFITLNNSSENYCYTCSIAINGGIKKKCEDCSKVFYTKKDSTTDKRTCYTCYLKKTSNKIDCITCGGEVYVNKENYSWKKQCYKCYLHSN